MVRGIFLNLLVFWIIEQEFVDRDSALVAAKVAALRAPLRRKDGDVRNGISMYALRQLVYE